MGEILKWQYGTGSGADIAGGILANRTMIWENENLS